MRLSDAVVYVAFFTVVSAAARGRRQSDECGLFDGDATRCADYWNGQRPPLIVISLDGFRSDYMNRNYADGGSLSPILNLMARCGVRAESMMPVYPTLTFPNHYSIVTGLYPESHGIVNNNFYDPDLELSFSLSNPNSTQPYWWFGEPVWYTAKKQNKKSATYFWPGSDVKDPVREPTYWYPYDGDVPYPDRIQQILQWLDLPVEERPSIVTVYFDEPDHAGHENGPASPLVGEQITRVDLQLQALLNGLEQRGQLGCVDIVVLADHGMAATPFGEYVVIMEPFVPDLLSTTRIYDGVFPNIRPNTDTQEEQDRIGEALECRDANLRVFNKWELPRRHHYAALERIPSLLLDLTVSWRAYARNEYPLEGNHGWDNLNDEMHATFVAQGPSFRRGLTVAPFRNLELYNLMCVLIGIEPAPNNGTWGALHHLLTSPPADPPVEPVAEPAVLTYPADQSTYDEHLVRTRCSLLTGTNEPATDGSLNLTESQVVESLRRHNPWGLPQNADEASADGVKVLVASQWVAGFDVESGSPSWVSYTLDSVRTAADQLQWRLDVRLEANHSSICDRIPDEMGLDADSVLVPLFPAEFASDDSDAAVDTNAAEVSTGFAPRLAALNRLVAQRWSSDGGVRGGVHVVVGPRREPMRSSLFAVVSACRTPASTVYDCPVYQLDVQSFILPTRSRYNGRCTDDDAFLALNVATLKDVELLSGLRLFPTLSYADRVALLTRTPLASSLLVDPDPEPTEPNEPTNPEGHGGAATPRQRIAVLIVALVLQVLAAHSFRL